jgi:hypothetical protein
MENGRGRIGVPRMADAAADVLAGDGTPPTGSDITATAIVFFSISPGCSPMTAATLPRGRVGPSARSWRGAAVIVGAWTLLGVVFLIEQGAAGQPALSAAMVFRRLAGPWLGGTPPSSPSARSG